MLPSSWMFVVAGLTGSFLMVLFFSFVPFFIGKHYKVVRILGTMLTGQSYVHHGLSKSKRATFAGLLVHYTTGCIFAALYYYLWKNGIGSPTLECTIFFGLINGLLAYVAWQLLFYIHPHPPHIYLLEYLFLFFIAHMIFAINVWVVYQIFN